MNINPEIYKFLSERTTKSVLSELQDRLDVRLSDFMLLAGPVLRDCMGNGENSDTGVVAFLDGSVGPLLEEVTPGMLNDPLCVSRLNPKHSGSVTLPKGTVVSGDQKKPTNEVVVQASKPDEVASTIVDGARLAAVNLSGRAGQLWGDNTELSDYLFEVAARN